MNQEVSPNHILIADNSVELLALYRLVFQRAGFSPLLANSAREAWECFHKKRECIRAVVTNGKLRGETGLWLAIRIREVSPVPIILCTAEPEPYFKVRDQNLLSVILEEPFEPELLCRILHDCLSRIDPGPTRFYRALLGFVGRG